ncbi:MAG: exo-alpha-sialidase [Candidatus Hydrogenedens sp.]|nr:exo-alpha-sialidase [Candidatus Hydrogenedens sp.]
MFVPRTLFTLVLAMLACGFASAQPLHALDLPPGPGNPRNSEGDFVTLKDGRILFVYTHFTGSGSDFGSAHLASRVSEDGGVTWSGEDVVVVPNEGGMNVMSVSLLRLADGRIALLYLRKDSKADCRPYLRISTDEAQTWSEPRLCIETPGYFVVNNDRLVQLKSGRLVIPASRHSLPGEEFQNRGTAICYLSDDGGATWRAGKGTIEAPEKSRTGLQEPLVVELNDGRIMLLARTDQGCQMRAYSTDGGDTWSAIERTGILSPVSPASLERMPGTGDLLLVWNNHVGIPEALKGKRTPLSAALSSDDGVTWGKAKDLEDSPTGWYCYTALEFTTDAVLLGYCAGNTEEEGGLGRTRITRVPLAWFEE